VSAYFEPLGDGRFRATEHTSGPWDAAAQHAGPPSALLARALEAIASDPERMLARVTLEILGPVPVGELEVEAAVVRPGRSVELLEAELRAGGRTAMRARAWRMLRAAADDVDGGAPPAPPRPDAESAGPKHWPYSGYLHSVEWRFARGGWDDPGPATVWSRLRVPIVPDEEPSPLQRVLAVADSGSGVSWVLPFAGWLFINPELTLHVQREAQGEWISLDAETTIAAGGAGVARSVLCDDRGPVAYGAQSLLVVPR
jgi:acyl-Coa thioesterase superfamily protein/acyl-CoA thioesterase superfamily protein